MTPSLVIRPVLLILLTAGVAACGQAGADPHRFETMAQHVAAIPLDGEAKAEPRVQTAREAGLRPAQEAVRVEVMDPHALWDARDGMVQQASSRIAAAAAPVVADAVLERAAARVEGAVSGAGLRPAVRSGPVQAARTVRADTGLVQLGAYSSEASARAAWARLSSGEAAWALAGLAPVFEGVDVGGRRLTRLKVQAPAAGAAVVCAAAGIDDPWCRRAA